VVDFTSDADFIQVFWHVLLSCQSYTNTVPSSSGSSSQNVFSHYLTLTMKALWCSKTSGITHPMTQHHIPQDLNLQQHHCENLRSLTFNILWLRKYEDMMFHIWYKDNTRDLKCIRNILKWQYELIQHSQQMYVFCNNIMPQQMIKCDMCSPWALTMIHSHLVNKGVNHTLLYLNNFTLSNWRKKL
jgi:hypothetical protein